jgi:glycerol kinase
MAKDIVIAIDQGTTGSTVVVLDQAQQVRAKATREFPQHFPSPGLVEHEPDQIWQSVLGALGDALAQAQVDPQSIAAVGITNQRETTLLWERAGGRPVHRAIVWQDRRTAPECDALRAAGHLPRVREKTGLVLDPYFSGTKLGWLLDHVGGARARAGKGELCFGTVDSYLVWRLTGGTVHVTDVTNASRTLLMDLQQGAWSDEMLALLRVPREVLPAIRSSSEVYGECRGVPGIPDGTPIAGIGGDQQAALFGQACFGVGDAKCTYGTGAFMLLNTGERAVPSHHGLLTTCAWQLGPKAPRLYALEGSAFIAGAAVQWLRDGLGLIKTAAEIEGLAAQVPDSGGVVFVPALTGLGAPHWRADARGILTGITRGTTRAHLARATLEGIAYQVDELLTAMREDTAAGGSHLQVTRLKVDGGASANDLLMQIQADLCGVPIVRPASLETTAIGAALLAGLAVGVWRSTDEIARGWRADREFSRKLDPGAVTRAREAWKSAVARA